jgi:hypothetical protein
MKQVHRPKAMRRAVLSDMGLTASSLLKNSLPYVTNAIGFVKVKQANKGKFRTVTEELGKTPRIHSQTISSVNNLPLNNPNCRLKVSCDCEFFLYVCEVALHRYGSADIIHSNGEFPYETNPRGIPMICKHLVKILKGMK